MHFRLNFCLLLLLAAITVEFKPAFANDADDLDDDSPPVADQIPIEEDIEFDENGVPKLKPSKDVDVYFKFTKPDGLSLELPAGKEVNFLVNFKNNAQQDFVVETLGASFRYPGDYNYVVQNYTTAVFNRLVKPNVESTFSYALIVNDLLSERPFLFSVDLQYRDATGKRFSSAAFNQTVNIVELDEGLNLQTLFIYLFLASLVFGSLYGIYSFVSSKLHIGKYTKKSKVETGTANVNEKVDFEWIPEQINSRNTPKATPKNKKAKKDN